MVKVLLCTYHRLFWDISARSETYFATVNSRVLTMCHNEGTPEQRTKSKGDSLATGVW